MNTTKWRAELHCHSEYSPDCRVSLARIIALCHDRQINVIALTDHNTIEGAVKLRQQAPDWLTVIVGEEIASTEGDIIGLFLSEQIPARLPITETIARIKAQKGVVLLPHPFDRLRHEAVGAAATDQIKRQLDGIEVFNARTVFATDDQRAATFAAEQQLTTFVGSDAHLPSEYGRAINLMAPFSTVAEFRRSLIDATFVTKRSFPTVHLQTKLAKWRRRD